MIFYVYVYYDTSRGNEPIYVGKGKEGRAFVHLHRRKYKHPFIQRLQLMKNNGVKPIIGFYSEMEEELAFLVEEELIRLIGRKDLGEGPLLNLTDGGSGGTPGYKLSQEQVERIRQNNKLKAGRKRSDDSKRLMSEVKKGKPWSDARREAYRLKKETNQPSTSVSATYNREQRKRRKENIS